MSVIDHQLLGRLKEIEAVLAHRFVEREELIKLLLLSWISRENLLIVGPTGTGKSELVDTAIANLHGQFFEILLTRFSEPQELFGPLDVKAFCDGKYCHQRDGKLPTADIAFFDEIFNANSAILNTLLSVLNERCYYDGNAKIPLPMVSAIAATMTISDEPTLRHLFDRFLLRIKVKTVSAHRATDLLLKGWHQEIYRQNRDRGAAPANDSLTIDDIRKIGAWIESIDLNAIRGDYTALIQQLRASGIEISDRRFVKLQKLLAASAIYHGQERATVLDLWILKHVWNREEQIPLLEQLVEQFIAEHRPQVPEPVRAAYPTATAAQTIEAEIAKLAAAASQDAFLRDCEQIQNQIHVLPAHEQQRLLAALAARRDQIMKESGWSC